MRRLIQWSLVPAAILAVACKGDKQTQASMADDLKRDLQLASATQNIRISPDEITPKAQQELAVRPKRAPQGPKVIRTEKPTIKASATPVNVAEIKTDIPAVQVMAASPAPSETPTDAPPLARPAPIPMPTYPSVAGIDDRSGSASGDVMGGVFGAVIRGGAVGDDHCDPRTDGRRGGRVMGGGVYRGPTSIGMGGSRGVPIVMGGGRTRAPVGISPRGR